MRKSLALCLLVLPLMSIAQHKHVHGEAELTIALENQSIVIEFISPSANLLGFESTPKSQKEVEAVKAVNTQLANYTNLISLVGADCEQTGYELTAGVKDWMEEHDEHQHGHHHEHDHHHNDHADHEKNKEEGHSDYKVRYQLSCSDVTTIDELTMTGFSRFAGLEKVDVDWVTANHQGSSDLSPNSVVIEIRH